MNKRTTTQFVNQKPELRNLEREEGETTIAGYGAIFYDGTPATEYKLADNIVERIHREAFEGIEAGDVISTLNHDPNFLLGRTSAGTLRLTVDDVGLRYEIPIRDDDIDHQKVVSKLRAGDLDGSSFWFQIEKEEKTIEEDTTVYSIRGLNLVEVGPVVLPAYQATTAELRSDHVGERIRDAEVLEEPQPEAAEPVADESKKLADLFYVDTQLWDVCPPKDAGGIG